MITRDGAKMSKSKGNMISPVPYVERYGADTARCYILFIGPPDHDADWTDKGVEGVHRFLGRLWRLGADVAASFGAARAAGPARRPRGRRPRADAQGALGDRQGHGGHGRAVRVQHRDRGRDGAGQRGLPPPRGGASLDAALRDRDGGVADLPVRAAHGLGRLRHAHGRPRVGAAVAGRRPVAAGARHRRGRAAGQRQAARPHPGARRRDARGARGRWRASSRGSRRT